jgi:hypothetical protein
MVATMREQDAYAAARVARCKEELAWSITWRAPERPRILGS